jgi:diaminohydroxyphosphoribosylaminopyrimidine deaminase / 5-amino-6-(5-phosphoribosylamino)uracil reductase
LPSSSAKQTSQRLADEAWMREALTLAARGRRRVSPNPMVGAVIVREGVVVGRGHHAQLGEAHAEVMALSEAGEAARGATLYCTLEPCCHHGRTPPCTEAVIASGVRRVVIGALDPSRKVDGKGAAALRGAGIVVETGCLEAEAERLNEAFNVFHRLGRPFVTAKWAMTLDGRTGADSNHSRWITNEASRSYVHEIRADHDAVVVGIGTVLADDPMLNVRIDGYEARQPKRIIIDGDLSIPRRARVLRTKQGGEVILVTTAHADPEAIEALEEDGHRVVVLPGRRRLIQIDELMKFLAQEELLSVLAEGGRQIHTAMLRAGVVDKVVAFVAPKLVGGRMLRSPVEDLGLTHMDKALMLKRVRWIPFGEDICLEGYLRDI